MPNEEKTGQPHGLELKITLDYFNASLDGSTLCRPYFSIEECACVSELNLITLRAIFFCSDVKWEKKTFSTSTCFSLLASSLQPRQCLS